MSRSDDGYILLDTITALLILSLTLTSLYGLIIKSLDTGNRLIERAETAFEESVENENKIQELFKE